MRIVVYVLFDFECLVVLFQHHADIHVQRLGCLGSFFIVFAVHGELRVVGILDPPAFVFLVFVHVNAGLYECLVQFIHAVEFSCEVNHRAGFSFLVEHEKRRNTGSLCHESVIRTEGRGDVYNACTVFCGYIISGNNPECFCRSILPSSVFFDFNGLYPWYELLVFHAYQLRTFVFSYNLERH